MRRGRFTLIRQHTAGDEGRLGLVVRIRSTKGYISVRNFGICESASVLETSRIKQETPKPWTRRIAPACQPFMTDTSVAAVMTTRLDRAGEVGHCWFIQTAREISRKRNGSRHFDIGSSHYRPRQGLSLAVSDRSSFRAIRAAISLPSGRASTSAFRLGF